MKTLRKKYFDGATWGQILLFGALMTAPWIALMLKL